VYDKGGDINATLYGYGRDYKDFGRNPEAFARILFNPDMSS